MCSVVKVRHPWVLNNFISVRCTYIKLITFTGTCYGTYLKYTKIDHRIYFMSFGENLLHIFCLINHKLGYNTGNTDYYFRCILNEHNYYVCREIWQR